MTVVGSQCRVAQAERLRNPRITRWSNQVRLTKVIIVPQGHVQSLSHELCKTNQMQMGRNDHHHAGLWPEWRPGC